MTTHRTEDLAAGDVTTWLRNEATELVTNKVYADGMGPTYGYTPDGRLSRRTWARGVTTDYSYDGQGRLLSKTYSDATPNVSLSYDRLGHTLSAVCVGVSTNLYAYNRLGQLTNEMQNGTTIARTYDVLGRPTGYVIGDGAAVGSAVSYGYDTLERFASVSSGTNVFAYSYLPGSSLVSGMTANTGHAWERIYEPDRDLIATVHNRYGDRTISRFDYTNDEIGRRIARVDSGEAFDETGFERYEYDARSQLLAARRYEGADTDDLSHPDPSRTFAYAYDACGNRLSESAPDGVHVFAANTLNQTVSRDGIPLSYDADGKIFAYEWDGENRLVSATGAQHALRFRYDYAGRLVERMEDNSPVRRIWDDYAVISEDRNGDMTRYVWGLDLSGTRQRAGGVGGLLSVSDGRSIRFPAFDANGNASAWTVSPSEVVLTREYGPFGPISLADEPGFQTMPAVLALGSVEYLHRHLLPRFTGWASRDINEANGGPNLYAFCRNDPINRYDVFGLNPARLHTIKDSIVMEECGHIEFNEIQRR